MTKQLTLSNDKVQQLIDTKAAKVFVAKDEGLYVFAKRNKKMVQFFFPGCDPSKDEDWYEEARHAAGDDDFAQEVPMSSLKEMLTDEVSAITFRITPNAIKMVAKSKASKSKTSKAKSSKAKSGKAKASESYDGPPLSFIFNAEAVAKMFADGTEIKIASVNLKSVFLYNAADAGKSNNRKVVYAIGQTPKENTPLPESVTAFDFVAIPGDKYVTEKLAGKQSIKITINSDGIKVFGVNKQSQSKSGGGAKAKIAKKTGGGSDAQVMATVTPGELPPETCTVGRQLRRHYAFLANGSEQPAAIAKARATGKLEAAGWTKRQIQSAFKEAKKVVDDMLAATA